MKFTRLNFLYIFVVYMDTMTNQDCHKKEINKANQQTKECVDSILSILDDMKNEASISSMLLEQNIQDSFSMMVSEAVKNPLKLNFEAFTKLEESLKSIINDLAINYLKEIKDSLSWVFLKENNTPVLHYTIGLKENTPANKKRLFDFLNIYENSVYNTRFPIIYQDIPGELSERFFSYLSDDKNYKRVI